MWHTRASVVLLVFALGAGLSAMAAPQPEKGSPAAGTRDFRIGIEDMLKVVVWGEPDLSLSVQVRPDGKITVPLVNDISVVGLSPGQVREKLTKRLAQFIRDPNVTVIVEQINSFRVYFLGEVNTQGPIQFFQPTRLLQAIAAAGGLTQYSKKQITLLRTENGVEKRIEIDYKKLIAGDPSQENLYLKPGDTLLFK